MTHVFVRFPYVSLPLMVDAGDSVVSPGDDVIVQTANGIDIGHSTSVPHDSVLRASDVAGTILRIANSADQEKIFEHKAQAREAAMFASKIMREQNLPMKLVDAHVSFDGSRITFYFTAESRVDFRELVKELTRHFQKAIRLQQIGSRDAARDCGGLGPCGRNLCCGTFLRDIGSITTEMARTQHMSSQGNERLSGVCGRLMCCLSYEMETYRTLEKTLPALRSSVTTRDGAATVVTVSVLKQMVKVRFANEEEKEYPVTTLRW